MSSPSQASVDLTMAGDEEDTLPGIHKTILLQHCVTCDSHCPFGLCALDRSPGPPVGGSGPVLLDS